MGPYNYEPLIFAFRGSLGEIRTWTFFTVHLFSPLIICCLLKYNITIFRVVIRLQGKNMVYVSVGRCRQAVMSDMKAASVGLRDQIITTRYLPYFLGFPQPVHHMSSDVFRLPEGGDETPSATCRLAHATRMVRVVYLVSACTCQGTMTPQNLGRLIWRHSR